MSTTLLALLFHVPFVVAWIGFAMFDVFATSAPNIEAGQRGRMLAWSRWFVILAIIVIMVTGIRQTMDTPFLFVNSWAKLQELKERTYGMALFLKHIAVVITFAMTVFLRFPFAARLMRLDSPSASASGGPLAGVMTDTESALRIGRLAAALNLLAGLAALVLTTIMIGELH